MRVLLIATNRHDRYMSRLAARPVPIGLAYVAGALTAAGHQVKVVDLMFSDDYRSEVTRAVQEWTPGLVGLSIRNLGDPSYLRPRWDLPISREVVAAVRSLTTAPIVCGGPAFSILPRAVFAFVAPDLGLAGDAAETLAQLADCVAAGASCHHLPGLVYRQDGAIVTNGSRATSTFAIRPRFDDLDMPRYARAGFGIGIVTKLGGLYYPRSASPAEVQEAAWRVIRPIDEVVEEARDLTQRYGLRKVFFIDNAFNVPLDHAKALCRALLAGGLSVRWNTTLAPPGGDAELVGLMRRAGCALALLSGPTGDPHDVASLADQLAPLLDACRLCEGQGLRYTISLPFGEPGETRATVDAKLAFLRRIRPALANLRIGANILPGTALAARALAEGLIADETELIRPTVYLDAAVRDWLVDDLQAAAGGQPRWNLV